MDDGGSDDGDDNSDLRVSKAPWREYKTILMKIMMTIDT